MDGNTRDTYTLSSIGNIHYQTALAERNTATRVEYIIKALEFYDKTLRVNGKCFVGAVGTGCCFVGLNRLEDAKQVFQNLLVLNFRHGFMNLAHVLVELGELDAGIGMYENCLSKFGGADDLYACIAHAYYVKGKTLKCPLTIYKAMTVMKKV